MLFACNNEPTNCPPGAFIDEWQVISDSKSTYKLDCSRQVSLKLGDYGSVWISSTKYRHDAGAALLGAVVTSCESSRVVMTVGGTTRMAVQRGDYYSLSADVVDPWLVAIGIQNITSCEATINRIEYHLAPHPDMSYNPSPDMTASQDAAIEDLNIDDLSNNDSD